MEKKRIVVALGGNALGQTAIEQRAIVRESAKPIVDLIEQGHEVVITHGNGPQVGIIKLAFDSSDLPEMPFPECGAMSQGYIGYNLQQAVRDELNARGIFRPVVSLVTQSIVDKNDPAFENPTKPVGLFYSKEEADKIAVETGWVFMEDAGRGYRRVVPSPRPQEIVEGDVIPPLLEAGVIVINAGGGGIPVLREGDQLVGVDAVIDKDFGALCEADQLDADFLVILTEVEKVAINFNKPNMKWLDNCTVDEMKQYMKEGHFSAGSMLPKVEACIAFAEKDPKRTSLITSLEKAGDGIKGLTGTQIRL
ncbi:MAG: carbamate kinase [Clostridiaceae bacterium]|jgi:carbamate kinase|nr:carbamate kinase [Clostridiaceae bacterium]